MEIAFSTGCGNSSSLLINVAAIPTRKAKTRGERKLVRMISKVSMASLILGWADRILDGLSAHRGQCGELRPS